MKINLSEIIKTKTLVDSAVTFFGTAINGLLGMIFYVLAARFLGPAVFGSLTIAITTLTLLADIANVGTDTGIIRFVGKYVKNEKEKALKFLKLGLEIKVGVWIVILILGYLLAPLAAEKIFLKPDLSDSLQLAVIGVGGAMLFSFVTHAIQALQKFKSWSILNISMNFLRLAVVLLLILSASLNLSSVLITYIAIPFLGFFLGLLFLPNFLRVKSETSVAKEFFHYNKWIALLALITAINSRLDTFLSARFLSVGAVGLYSAANQLTSAVPQLVFALATVVAPRLASFGKDTQTFNYLKKVQLFVCGLAVISLLAIPVGYFLIPLIFGSKYQTSFTPFALLLIAQLIFLISLPAHQAIYYYFAKPKIFVLINLISLILMLTVGSLLIKNFGIIGAAGAVLLVNLFNFLLPFIWVLKKFKK